MAIYFVDTSALVKRYVQEVGTPWLQSLASPTSGHSLFVSRITYVETIAALTRRERSGSIAPADVTAALIDFENDFGEQYFILEMDSGVIRQAAALARKHGLRGYDAVQLAEVLVLHASGTDLIFLSADRELNAVARTEGVAVDDPNAHP